MKRPLSNWNISTMFRNIQFIYLDQKFWALPIIDSMEDASIIVNEPYKCRKDGLLKYE